MRGVSQTNLAIQQVFHQGGNRAPIVPVVTLPAGRSVSSPVVRRDLTAVSARLARALPGARIASFAATGSRAFVSRDGRTTFVLAYPLPDHEAFGNNTKAAKAAAAALAGVTVAGAPVHVSGVDALQNQTGGGSGPGVLLESVLGGLGALVVLGFVFASLLAFVPLLMAIVSIMAAFLVLWGVTTVTSVSMIVEFLVALIGLGVAIDYSLIVVVRWREERAHGHEGDEAVVRAMATAGRAVVLSGTTVAIGLLAMIVLPLPFLRSIGYAGMLIPLISVIVATTLLPIVLATIGPRLDWPHIRSDDQASRSWTRWAQLVVRRRWFAAAGAAVVLALLVIAASSLQPGAANVNTLAKQGDAHAGLAALERSGVGAGALTPVELLASASAANRAVSAAAGVRAVQGAVAPSATAWRRGGAAVVDAFVIPDISTNAGLNAIDRIRTRAHGLRAGVRVGGIGAENEDFVSAIYGSFPLMIVLIPGLAAGPRLEPAVRDCRHPLDHRLDPADGVCVPVRAVDGLRGVHPRAHARGVRRHRLDQHGRDPRNRPHRPAGHQRRADPVPRLRLDGRGAGDRHQGVRHRPGRRHPARRDDHPGAAGARGGVAVRALELVAARAPGPAAARRALAAAPPRARHRGRLTWPRRLSAGGGVGPAEASVDEKGRRVDVAGLVAGQEQDGVGDLLGGPEAAHRHVDHPPRGLDGIGGVELAQQRGVDRARAQRVDPDPALGELDPELAR